MGSRDLALARGADKDEIVAIDDGGTANERNGWNIATCGVGLAPEHRHGGFGTVNGGGIMGGVFARRGDLAQHGARIERAGRDGDGFASVVAEGFPDEEASGMGVSVSVVMSYPLSLKVRATISPQGRAVVVRPGCG